VLMVLPIYAASEQPIEGIDSRALCESIQVHGHKDVRFAESLEDAVSALADLVVSEDVVLTLGAGNVYQVGEMLVTRLRGQEKEVKGTKAEK
jgi:UDP-N-acetylmuramate--alanine ligase